MSTRLLLVVPAGAIQPQGQARWDRFQFRVDGASDVEWGWMTPGRWVMSYRDSNSRTWEEGPLTEKGRQVVLKRFGLEFIAAQLPLGVVDGIPPEMLLELRAEIGREHGLSEWQLVNDYVPVSLAA